MKKLIIILLILLTTTSCTKYIELNTLSIISNITISIEQDKYKVVMQEIIPKKADNKVDYTYKYRTSSSKNLKTAIKNITNHSPKTIYLNKVQNIIISNKNKEKIIKSFYNYYKKNKQFNKEASLVITKNDLTKVLKVNSNYEYIDSVLKEKKKLLKDLSSKKKSKIPILKISSKELIFVKYYYLQL